MKTYLKIIILLFIFTSKVEAQEIRSWGTIYDNNNDIISLYLGTNSNFNNLPIYHENNLNDIQFLYGSKNNLIISSVDVLKYSSLFQSYTLIKNIDYLDFSNRAILPLEAPSGGVFADPEEGNYFRIRLPFDGGIDDVNNDIILSGNITGRGLQNNTKRRLLWRDLFISTIIQSEILTDEMRNQNNITYKSAQLSQFNEFQNKLSTANTAVIKVVDALKYGATLHEIGISNNAPSDIIEYLNNMANISIDVNIQKRLEQLGTALSVIKVGTDISSSTFKTLILRTLQTAEADKRLQILEGWITSGNPGYNDSEIYNGFLDAKELYNKICNETFNAILEETLTNQEMWKDLFDIAIQPVMKKVIEKLPNTYHIPYAHGIFFAVSELVDLGIELNDKYDLLRLASLSATLEEYLGNYIHGNLLNINNNESNIELKQTLLQINSFLGYFYFKQIKQVYDNAWYTKINLLIELSSFFSTGGITKEQVIEYCDNGILRNIPKYDNYCQPFWMAKPEITWFSSLIENFNIIEPVIYNGKVSSNQTVTGSPIVFSLIFKDLTNQAPFDIKVYIDGTGYSMTKDPADNIFTDGVQYTYTSAFASHKTYYYSFSASASDGTALAPFPETGSMNFYVTQSSVGWEAAIDPLNTNYSPAAVKKGTVLSINTGIKNTGQNSYANISGKVEMRNSQGVLVASTNFESGTITIGNTSVIASQLTVPSNGIDGTYTLTSIIFPTLDTDPTNNSYSNSFFIGENLGNEKFRSNGQAEVRTGNNLTITNSSGVSRNFYLNGVNTSTEYATFRDPGGSMASTYVGRIRIYGSYDCFIQNDAVWSDGTYGYAAVHGAYATTSGPVFDNDVSELGAYPGQSIDVYATAPSGLTFIDTKGNYELFSPSTTDIKNWFSSISKVGTFSRIRIRFTIPSNAPLGKTVLYFKTEYSNSSYADFSRLTFYITNPPPALTSISKSAISADDQITITGSNLGTTGTINFGNVNAASISWTNTSITCTVPQGIITGILTVTNSNGTSNGLAYTVISSTGAPILNYVVPDQTMSQNETRLIANLNEVFSDPNNGTLTYSATSDNPDISINTSEMSIGNLQLIASAGLLANTNISITATDNTGKFVSDNFTIFATKILKVAPPFSFVETSSGTTTFTVTSNVDWSVSESSDWLTASKANANTLTITYNANASVDSRSAGITLSGTSVTSQVVTVNQAGATPTLSVTPPSQQVSSSTGTTTFTVSSNVDWLVSESSDWLTATKTNATTLTVTYDANASVDSRSASITLSGTGVTSQVVTVNQAGATPILSVTPTSQPVSSPAGTTSFSVLSNIGWTVSSNQGWCTITPSGSGNGTITAIYTANTATSIRTATITVSGTGVSNQVVTVTQAAVSPILTVSPSNQDVTSSSGSTTFAVTSNIGWTATSNQGWCTITPSGTGNGTITATYTANTGISIRTATITVSGTGVSNQVVSVSQVGTNPVLTVTPSNQDVTSSSGSITFTVTSNVDWSVNDSSDWLTVIKTNTTTLTVTYNSNTSIDNRSASITLTGIGLTSQVVTVNQAGAIPTLNVTPPIRSVSYIAGTTTYLITSNIEWSISESSDWLSANKTNATTLTLMYDANNNLNERSSDITLEGEGVAPQIVTITQAGNIPNAIVDIFDNIIIKIYPNPASDWIHLTSASDINSVLAITIFDDSGKLVYSKTISNLNAEDKYEIDISSFESGIHLLKINDAESYKIEKVIKE